LVENKKGIVDSWIQKDRYINRFNPF